MPNILHKKIVVDLKGLIMKQLILSLGIILIIAACSTQKSATKVEGNTNEELVDESIEYGIITFGSKFNTWYQEHKKPELYHSQEYYEDWNIKYVDAWNRKVIGSNRSHFFKSAIEYTSGIDYGFELNHELFYYFQYVEKVLKIKIVQDGPKE